MQRDRNIPDMEQSDISLFMDIIVKKCEMLLLIMAGVLSLFSLLFMYYNFSLAFQIVKYVFYAFGLYNIYQYICENFNSYIDKLKKIPVFSPFGKSDIHD